MALARRNEVETDAAAAAAPQTAETAQPTQAAASQATEAEVLDEPTKTEPPKTTAVAARSTTAVAPAAAPKGQAITALAEAGFAGLNIDWTSFPTIVLNGGEFETSDGHPLKATEFHVRLQQSRSRFVYRTDVAKDEDAELAYTYNPAELDDPESDLAKKVAEWVGEGLTFSVKEYIEAVAFVEDENLPSLDGQMVLVQIPPTSKGRFSGYLTANLMAGHGAPSNYLTRCYRGEKVTKAKNPFYPWAFERA